MTSSRRFVLLIAAIAVAAFLLAWRVDVAYSHYRPGTHNAVHAIQLAWCGRADSSCAAGGEAIRVARCEASDYWRLGVPAQARNGQYRGMFQMGAWERATFGHGPDPWSQAFAARRYYRAALREDGYPWSRWTCKP